MNLPENNGSTTASSPMPTKLLWMRLSQTMAKTPMPAVHGQKSKLVFTRSCVREPPDIIREEAEADISEAAIWYQLQRAGFG